MMTSVLEAHTSSLDNALLERLEKCTNLPSPPIVATRILELSQDPEVDIGSVADVISIDPALVAKVLRIANSSMYATRRKTENLRQAIMLLGLNGTLTMALNFSLASSMHNNACQGFDYNLFWRRSLASAACCRRLSITTGLGTSEEMFLMGLLQDIGMLAIDKMQPDFYASLNIDQSDHVLLQQKEREVLGADHAVIGAWLMHKWGLPDMIRSALTGSHDLRLVDPDDEHIMYTRCVMVSGLLVDVLSGENAAQDLVPLLQRVRGLLGVEEDALAEILGPLNADFIETALLFETDLADYGLSDTLIDQARETLLLRSLQTIKQSDDLQDEANVLENRTRTLEEQVLRDRLTGLYNRAYLDDALTKEFEMAQARDWPLAVAFIDLDAFKRVNDVYGHQAGDYVLQQSAAILSAGTRDTDVVARYGGEEFVIILPGCDEQAARVVTDRLINAFRDTVQHVNDTDEIRVTASIGFSIIGNGNNFADVIAMVAAADRAVYEAKRLGRNRCVMYSGLLDRPVRKSG